MIQTMHAWMLIPWAVRNTVPERVPGVYILGEFNMRKGFAPVYVGRSDFDVRSRLIAHCSGAGFRYFVVRTCARALEAFQRECFYWHALRGSDRLLNVYHPDSPSGFGLACPYCEADHFRSSHS